MAKSKARYLGELLGSDGLVQASLSALAGPDGIVDLEVLPTIPNAKLENSTITISGNSISLGGSHSLDTSDVSEHASYLYYTDTRVGAYLSANSYATQGYVTTQIANLVDSAPATLDTLNELAAALGDDPNFATTVTNSIATKLPLSGGTLSGPLTVNAAVTLNSITTDSSILFDQNFGIIANTSATDQGLFLGGATGNTDGASIGLYGITNASQAGNVFITSGGVTGTGAVYFRRRLDSTFENSMVIDSSGRVGIGTSSPTYALDVVGTIESTGSLAFINKTSDARMHIGANSSGYSGVFASRYLSDSGALRYGTYWAYDCYWDDTAQSWYANRTSLSNKTVIEQNYHQGAAFKFRYYGGSASSGWADSAWTDLLSISTAGTVTATAFSGSGASLTNVNATTLDSLDSTQFLRSDTNDTFTSAITGNTLYLGGGQIMTSSASLQVNGFMRTGNIYLHEGGNSPTTNNLPLSNSGGTLTWDSNTVWNAGNDGSGSGLDADLLDGVHGSSFLRSDANDILTATIEHSYSSVIWQHGEGAFRPVSRKTYSEAGSIGTTGSNFTDVYGESDLASIDNDETFTYEAAWAAVETFGGRLPTLSEVMDGVGKGSGQGYDAEFIWTCTPAGPHHVWVCKGSYIGTTDRKIVDITDPLEVYRTRAFFDVSRDNRISTYSSDGNLRAGDNLIWHEGNDGSGSGLDADLLDGQHGSYYYSSANMPPGTSTTGPWTTHTTAYGNIQLGPANTSWAHIYSSGPDFYFNKQLYVLGNKVWNAGNDGSGSGLDADTVDGIQAASFLRSDASDTTTGSLTVNGALITDTIRDRSGSQLILLAGEATSDASQTSEKVFVNAESGFEVAASNDNWATGYAGTRKTLINYNGITYNGNEVWHAGNDGSGSGLDADLLDGWQLQNLARVQYSQTSTTLNNNTTLSSGFYTTSDGPGIGLPSGWHHIINMHHGDNNGYNAQISVDLSESTDLYMRGANGGSWGAWQKIWHAGNDGSGSGLDADTLDGLQPSVSASNNTIVQRHSSGYIFANYFNTTPNDVSSGVTKVCVETGNDGYIRHGSPDSIALFLDGVSGGSISTATNNGAVNYVYASAGGTPTRGSCGVHVYHQWSANLSLTLTSSTWQRGDMVVVKNTRGTNVTVTATRIYLPNGSYDTSVTFNGVVGSFTLIKYTTTTGYWMVGP